MFVRFRALSAIVVVAALFAALLAAISTPAQAVSDDTGGVYMPVPPKRLLDATGSRFSAGETRDVTVLGAAGIPSSGVSAVVVDVAVTYATSTSSSYVTMWPDGETRPGAATMFYSAENAPRSNTAVVKVGASGKISVYNYAGTAGLTVDVQGYFTTASDANSVGGFVPITPTRVANSSSGIGMPAGKIPVNGTRTIQVTNGDSIPADATSVFANIEVRNATANGGIKVGPGGTELGGSTVAMNYNDSAPSNTGMTVKLSSAGAMKVLVVPDASIDIKVDIQGYFSGDSTQGGSYTALTTATVYSSTSTGMIPLAAGATRVIQVTGKAGIPDDTIVSAVALNVTAKHWTSGGTVTVYNADEPLPGTTNVSFTGTNGDPSNGISSLAIVGVSEAGQIRIHNSSSNPVDFYLTAQGWFSGGPVVENVSEESTESEPGFTLLAANNGVSEDEINDLIDHGNLPIEEARITFEGMESDLTIGVDTVTDVDSDGLDAEVLATLTDLNDLNADLSEGETIDESYQATLDEAETEVAAGVDYTEVVVSGTPESLPAGMTAVPPEPADVSISSDSDCGKYWWPNYLEAKAGASSVSGYRFGQTKFKWTNATRLNALKCYDDVTFEPDYATWSGDDLNYFTNKIAAWSTTMPNGYKDTKLLDGANERTYTIGTSDARKLKYNTQYKTYFRTKKGNSSTDSGKVNVQRGNRTPSVCHSTYCIFGKQSVYYIPAGTLKLPGTKWVYK